MRLHEEKTLFRQAVIATAAHLNIPEIFVEKDYWVTYALHRIFHDPIGKETVFKGGTALSKCFGLIDRFSEDIDLVVRRQSGETDNQLKSKIKKVGQVVAAKLPEVKVDGLTRKMGMNRKTAHSYPRLFDGRFIQVRNEIVIEATWYGSYEPSNVNQLSSYINILLIEKGQLDKIDEFGLHPFEVNVLHVNRTFWEKIMSLVRFSYGDNPIDNLRMKIRHIYDLHKMLELRDIDGFFNSNEFATLICRVAQDDVQSFRNNNEWLMRHPADAMLFRDLEKCWDELRTTYTNEFSGLVYGSFPDEQPILNSLTRIKERLLAIKWDLG